MDNIENYLKKKNTFDMDLFMKIFILINSQEEDDEITDVSILDLEVD